MDLLKQAMKIKTDGLFLCILGPSGAGKSHVLGTYPGRTLMIYGAGESHGPASATKSNKDLIPIAWDRDNEGNVIAPNQQLKRIKDMLEPDTIKKAGVKCVVLDSLTNLSRDLIHMDQFKQRCMSNRGTHNAFKETEAHIELLSGIINKLQLLHDFHDIDVVVTLDLAIQAIGADGTILESKPGLPTFGVGKAIIQQFADILVLGRMGEKRIPMFQNMSTPVSTSKDMETKEVVKYVEYNPRLKGVKDIPETLEPSLKTLLDLKKKG